jgi:hypothetical protein
MLKPQEMSSQTAILTVCLLFFFVKQVKMIILWLVLFTEDEQTDTLWIPIWFPGMDKCTFFLSVILPPIFTLHNSNGISKRNNIISSAKSFVWERIQYEALQRPKYQKNHRAGRDLSNPRAEWIAVHTLNCAHYIWKGHSLSTLFRSCPPSREHCPGVERLGRESKGEASVLHEPTSPLSNTDSSKEAIL